MLQCVAEREHTDVQLFGSFPTAQLFDRLWRNIIPNLSLSSDNPFDAVVQAAAAAEDQEAFVAIDGDWQEVEGDVEGDGMISAADDALGLAARGGQGDLSARPSELL